MPYLEHADALTLEAIKPGMDVTTIFRGRVAMSGVVEEMPRLVGNAPDNIDEGWASDGIIRANDELHKFDPVRAGLARDRYTGEWAKDTFTVLSDSDIAREAQEATAISAEFDAYINGVKETRGFTDNRERRESAEFQALIGRGPRAVCVGLDYAEKLAGQGEDPGDILTTVLLLGVEHPRNFYEDELEEAVAAVFEGWVKAIK